MNAKIENAIRLTLLLKSRLFDAPASQLIVDVESLGKLASRATSRAIANCNGWIDTERLERQTSAIEKRADVILLPYGLRSRTTGDPRGFCLRLHALPCSPSVRGNTWGGDEGGYGI